MEESKRETEAGRELREKNDRKESRKVEREKEEEDRERGRRWRKRGCGSLMENVSFTFTYKLPCWTHMQRSDSCYGPQLSLISDWVCSGRSQCPAN